MDVLSPTTLTHVAFRDDVLAGLLRPLRRLPGKYAYDRRGSLLFEAVCAQPEYYLARAEQQIIERHGDEMASEIGQGATVVELGRGTAAGTWHLLKQLDHPAAYVPVDPFQDRLLSAADALQRDFSGLEIHPVCGDFTAPYSLSVYLDDASRRVAFVPGATIGNLEPYGAVRLLHGIGRMCGRGGGLLVGVDLVKDSDVVEPAYNDRAGVMAEFNLNLLLRINRELGGEFDLDEFEHLAFYDRRFERMDIRLVSKIDQEVRVNGIPFVLHAQEPIQTHYAHKHTLDRFARLAKEAGLALRRAWTDEREYFAVVYLTSDV